MIAVLASLRDPLQRWLVGIFVVPLGLIWAMAFSYDLRNLAMIVPWVGAAAGNGLVQIVSWGDELYRRRLRSTPTRSVSEETTSFPGWRPRWRPRLRFGLVSVAAADDEDSVRNNFRRMDLRVRPALGDGLGGPSYKSGGCFAPSPKQGSISETASPPRFLRVGHLVGLLTFLVIAVCLCVSNETLLKSQRRQQRTVGVPELNRELYAYDADHPGDARIATDYQAMRWLPELGRRGVVCTCHNLAAFRQTFDRADVRYLLVRTQGAAAEVRAFLQNRAAARFIFENHGFAFYEKRPLRPTTVAAVP
jgi:hypothetical protein